MFTHSCYIRKNTPELKEKLESLGYTFSGFLNKNGEYIVTTTTCFIEQYSIVNEYYINEKNPHISWSINRIDCGTNEDLFFALAALRNDSDKYQWFICDEGIQGYDKDGFVKWFEFEGDWKFCEDNEFDTYGDSTRWHKATVEELIEHFSDINKLKK